MNAKETPDEKPRRRPPTGASRVALGIATSRILGFLREMALAYFFGVGPYADVFRTALRGPNLLQNLLGEQTLSASFIPVYSRLLAEERREEAGRFAGAIFGLLLALAAGLSLVGVLLAEPIVSLLAPGYLADSAGVAAGQLSVDRFPLAVQAVRIIFPMTGILVLSAWALGVLNSHRRFFISYMAPALWNAAIVASLFLAWVSVTEPGGGGVPIQSTLLVAACFGALVGGGLQFAVQLPWTLRLMRGFRPSLSLQVEGVREALRSFVPLVAGRGAVQLSGYLDFFLGSFLAAGAVAALGWAQTLYLLPIGLFGMSVAAAELPELARKKSETRPAAAVLARVRSAFKQMTFLTVPSAVGFVLFGYLIVAVLFRRGEFGAADNWLVYLVLVAYSLGLVASTTSRLLNNVFYAMGETRVPARIAMERVALSAALGVVLMLGLDTYAVNDLFVPTAPGRRLFLGAVGLALGAGISSWYELARLHRSLAGTLGALSLPWRYTMKLGCLAVLAGLLGLILWYFLEGRSVLLVAPVVLTTFGSTYLFVSRWLGLTQLEAWLGRAPETEIENGGSE